MSGASPRRTPAMISSRVRSTTVTSTPVSAVKASIVAVRPSSTPAGAHRVNEAPGTDSMTVTDPVVGVGAMVVVGVGTGGWVDVVVVLDSDPVHEAASSDRAMTGRRRRIGGGEA